MTGLDTRGLTNFIRDNGAPRGTISNDRNGNFGIKKLIKNTLKWPGLMVWIWQKQYLLKISSPGKVLRHGLKKMDIKKLKRKNLRSLQSIME